MLQRRHLLLQSPAPHALSGYDTIAQCFGVGKCTITKVLRSEVALHQLGVIPEDLDDVIKEAAVFVAACYRVKKLFSSNMSDVRGEIWSRRMRKKNVTNAPYLTSLPPIKESFDENVKHTNVQTSIWKSALNQQPSYLYLVEYGWEHDM